MLHGTANAHEPDHGMERAEPRERDDRRIGRWNRRGEAELGEERSERGREEESALNERVESAEANEDSSTKGSTLAFAAALVVIFELRFRRHRYGVIGEDEGDWGGFGLLTRRK